jgi:hypothetical protein
LGDLEPPCDQFDISSGGSDAARGFLLEGVQDIDNLTKSDSVDGSISVAIMVLDHLKDTAPWPFHGFALGCLPPN